MAVSEQIFQALIYGHSKLGQLESADQVIVAMKEAGLEVDSTTHGTKLLGKEKVIM